MQWLYWFRYNDVCFFLYVNIFLVEIMHRFTLRYWTITTNNKKIMLIIFYTIVFRCNDNYFKIKYLLNFRRLHLIFLRDIEYRYYYIMLYSTYIKCSNNVSNTLRGDKIFCIISGFIVKNKLTYHCNDLSRIGSFELQYVLYLLLSVIRWLCSTTKILSICQKKKGLILCI